jgi:hypothetical protein
MNTMNASKIAVELLTQVLPSLMEAAEATSLPSDQKLQLVLKNLGDHVEALPGITDEKRQLIEMVKELAPPVIALLCRATKGFFKINETRHCLPCCHTQ